MPIFCIGVTSSTPVIQSEPMCRLTETAASKVSSHLVRFIRTIRQSEPKQFGKANQRIVYKNIIDKVNQTKIWLDLAFLSMKNT
jgi:hypothetical protein